MIFGGELCQVDMGFRDTSEHRSDARCRGVGRESDVGKSGCDARGEFRREVRESHRVTEDFSVFEESDSEDNFGVRAVDRIGDVYARCVNANFGFDVDALSDDYIAPAVE